MAAGGFTLLEMILAIALAVGVLTMAIPSVTGFFSGERLRAIFAKFDRLVQEARQRSVSERRAYVIVWDDGRIVLLPEEPREDDPPQAQESLAVERGDDFIIQFPSALVEKWAPVWTFWPTGTCEAAVVRYEGKEGVWVARYDPLTANALLEESAPR